MNATGYAPRYMLCAFLKAYVLSMEEMVCIKDRNKEAM